MNARFSASYGVRNGRSGTVRIKSRTSDANSGEREALYRVPYWDQTKRSFFLHAPPFALRCARTSSNHLSLVRAKVRSWRLGWDALKDAIVALAHASNIT